MLGLPNGLQYGGYLNINVFSYCSDFSSDADSWQALSIEASASDLSLTANANPYTDNGGSAPNSAGWLKLEYQEDQTDSESGIQLILDESPFNFDSLSGDNWYWTGSIYIHNDDNYSGTDGSTISATLKINNNTVGIVLSPGSVHSIDRTVLNETSTNTDIVLIDFSGTRKPENGCTIYVKDLCINVDRP